MSIIRSILNRLLLKSDSTVTTQTTAVIQATTTDSGIAIVPNGTGAITAQVPDGTATGGNARGQYAVDLQRSRTANTQVASGQNSVISGGSTNSASSNFSTISGGQSNTASTNSHATVVGGQSNVSSGQHSVSGGFTNTASGGRSVAMGDNNRASGVRSVAMGNDNTASGNNSVALGGEGSVASGNSSFAIGGSVTASGLYSHVMGFDNIAQGSRSFALGGGASAYLTGQLSLSQGKTGIGGAQNGNAQQSLLTAKREDILTTAATTVLSLDGTGTTNLIIPNGNNRAWNVTVEYVGVCTVQGSGTTVVGDVVTGTDKFRFKRVGGTSTIGAVTNIELTQDATMTASTCTYAVGTSNSLQITFVAPTTANATTFRVVAKVSLVEVAW